MQANPVSILSVLQGTKVYQVPIYQRRYSWRAAEWSSLWDDLEFKVAESDTPGGARPHFLGNIVVQALADPDSTVVKYLVIDGQQRLTTLIVFLAALRDAKVSKVPGWNPAEYDSKYLINPFDPNERDRLVPTEFDREDYSSTVTGGKPSGGIGRAYLYFSRKLREHTAQQLDVIANTVLRKFLVILVETDEMDPVNTIFNTLNSKGRPLLPPDLIRNEIFMHLDPDQADRVYRKQWLPLESSLVKSSPAGNLQSADFTTFFWSREVPSSPSLSKKMLFNAFESRLRKQLENKSSPQKAAIVLEEVDDIISDLGLFMALRNPATLAKDEGLDVSVESALIELDEWGSDTHIPIALWVLKSLRDGRLGDGAAVGVLRTTLSFMVSRALTGVPTNTLSRILSKIPSLLNAPQAVSPLSAVAAELSRSGNRWPSMMEAGRSVKEFGLAALSPKQQSIFRNRVGDPKELEIQETVSRLEDWLIARPADESKSLFDPERLLSENLFNALETFTPYEFTTVQELSIALRASADSIRLHINGLENPLLELVRTSGDKGLAPFVTSEAPIVDRDFSRGEIAAEQRRLVSADEISSRLSADPDQVLAESFGQ